MREPTHGQLLVSGEWFKSQYSNSNYTLISVHPNSYATTNAIATTSKALTYDKLNQLLTEARILFRKLCDSVLSDEQLVVECEQMLNEHKLNPKLLGENYLVNFESP